MGLLSDLYQIKLYTVKDGETHKFYYDKRKDEVWSEILINLEDIWGKFQLRGINRVRKLVEERNLVK